MTDEMDRLFDGSRRRNATIRVAELRDVATELGAVVQQILAVADAAAGCPAIAYTPTTKERAREALTAFYRSVAHGWDDERGPGHIQAE